MLGTLSGRVAFPNARQVVSEVSRTMRRFPVLWFLGALFVLSVALPSFGATRSGDPVKPVPWKSR